MTKNGATITSIALLTFVVIVSPLKSDDATTPKDILILKPNVSTNLRKRVVVSELEKEVGSTKYQLGDLGDLTDELIGALVDTGQFLVLDRQVFAPALGDKGVRHAPLEAGVIGISSAQILIRGAVTDVGIADSGGGLRLGRFYIGGRRQSVYIKIRLYVKDTLTGHTLDWKVAEGSAEFRRFLVTRRIEDVKTSVKHQRFVREAMAKAAANAVAKIVGTMEQIVWQGCVARVFGRQIILNAGHTENLEPGMMFQVLQRGAEIIDPATGEVLGTLDEKIGLIRIEEVESRFSVARIVEGTGFARGNIVRPMRSTLLIPIH